MDAAIRDMVGNDLPALVRALPDLRAVAFNGATAHRHGAKLLAAASPVPGVALIALPSSSALHTIGAAAKQPAWDKLRNFLG